MAQEQEIEFIQLDQVAEIIDSAKLPTQVKRNLLEKINSLKPREDNFEIFKKWYYKVLKKELEDEEEETERQQTLGEHLDYLRNETIRELLGIDFLDLDWLETVRVNEVSGYVYDQCEDLTKVKLPDLPSLKEMPDELEALEEE